MIGIGEAPKLFSETSISVKLSHFASPWQSAVSSMRLGTDAPKSLPAKFNDVTTEFEFVEIAPMRCSRGELFSQQTPSMSVAIFPRRNRIGL